MKPKISKLKWFLNVLIHVYSGTCWNGCHEIDTLQKSILKLVKFISEFHPCEYSAVSQLTIMITFLV